MTRHMYVHESSVANRFRHPRKISFGDRQMPLAKNAQAGHSGLNGSSGNWAERVDYRHRP